MNYKSKACQVGGLLLDSGSLEAGALSSAFLAFQAWPGTLHMEETQYLLE